MESRPQFAEKKRSRLAVLCLFVLPLFFAPVYPQQDLPEFEKRLARINEDIRALREKISDAEKRESGLLSQMDQIAFNKTLIKNELALYNLQLERTSQELAGIRRDIAGLREKLRTEQQSIEKTLVTLYKFGKFDFLQFLLEAENMSALFSESKHLGLLARYQQDIVGSYLKTLSDLSTAEKAQVKKRAEVDQLIRDAAAKKQELEVQETENKALVQQIRKNKKLYEQALAEQNERAQHLQSLMNKLASQEIVLPFRFIPLYEKKGKLPWPMAGKVITRFGRERYLNTTTMNNGIEIAPPKDSTVVRAIHPGKIVYADYFQGYGNLLIIDHGLNYYTLYGHCAEFLVNKGDFVKEEQPIAVAGDSGSLKGLSLYLEVRFKTKPLDPLQWLKRR